MPVAGGLNTAIAAAGRLRGAAKVSVPSSALLARSPGPRRQRRLTGMVTLPSMRRPWRPEADCRGGGGPASTGGQIMLPLMGAGAFVMVELTGIPATQIILAARCRRPRLRHCLDQNGCRPA